MKLSRFINWKTTLSRLAAEGTESPARAASAAALGVFFGIAPFWGFQFVLALLAASFFKLNRLIAGAASNISVPPFIPFIVYASVTLGSIVTGRPVRAGSFFHAGGLRAAADAAPQYLLGGLLLALICAMAAWALAYAAVLVFSKKKEIGKVNG